MSEMRLQKMIEKASRIVFFGGAGVSTGSRIPDFRGANGLEKETKDGLTVEMILSKSFFYLHPDLFYRYYREHLLFLYAEPNRAHLKLAEMERKNCLAAIVTQNIDGLHQKAGSRAVYPLHGSIYENTCMECGRPCPVERVLEAQEVPRCPACGGVIRPGITLYGEAPDPLVMRGACREIARADLLIVAGTSLSVEPAASCLAYFHGRELVVINEEPLEIENRATLSIHGRVEEVLGEIQVPEKPQRMRQNWWS